MPIHYKIFEKLSLVYAVGSGRVTQEELTEHLETLAQDPKYKPPMKKIVDYRNIPFMPLSPADAHKLKTEQTVTKNIFSEEKCAIVTSNDYLFGMSQVHGAGLDLEELGSGMFRYLDDAAAWLNIEIDEACLKIDPPPDK